MKYPLWLSVLVKLEDIALGRAGDCTSCPIARALRRLGFEHFTVNDTVIEFADGAKYQTSTAAREFIMKVDAGYNVLSTSFTFRRTSLPRGVESRATGVLEVARG